MVILQNVILTFCLYTYPLLNPFLPNVKVNQAPHDFTIWPKIAVAPSGVIYIAYNVDVGWIPPESTHIYLNVSFDLGNTFEPDRIILKGNKYNEILALDVERNEKVHLLYENSPNLNTDDHLFYTSSGDSGQSFPINCQVDDSPVPIPIGLADFAINDSGNIYVLWNDGRDYFSHIYFSKSTDSGQTFSGNVLIDTGEVTKDGYHPSITLVANGTIYLTWMQQKSGREDIYFCKSTDQGNSFTEKIRVDTFSIYTYMPDITTIGNDSIFICYITLSSSLNSVYLSRSTDGGNSFTSTVQINDSLFSHCDEPSICTTKDGKIHTIWEMLYNPLKKQEINADIYYDFSTDGGLTFNTDVMVNDDTSDSTRQTPSLDKDMSGNIYVAWNDWRNGYDIYFARTDIQGVDERKKDKNISSNSLSYRLLHISPNPFYSESRIDYQVLYPTYIKLEVLDLAGKTIKTLVNERKQIGHYKVIWKGDDSKGKKICSGIYFVYLESNSCLSAKKIILLSR